MENPERTVPMTITIRAGKDFISERKFPLYPGTELVYAQGVDIAVTQALATISKVAYELVSSGEGVPGNVALESAFGMALQDAD